METRTIITPPGIGDFLFLAQKLQNQPEAFNIIMPSSTPQRGGQLHSLLPNLIASHTYEDGLSYKKINQLNAAANKQWCQIKDQNFYLSANAHLESGRRIEGFLSDLPTSYTLNYATTLDDRAVANARLYGGKVTGRHYIGLYTSAYSNTRNWNLWGAVEWFELIKLLNKPDYVFVIIGAVYDFGVVEDLMTLMDASGIRYINTTGEPLSVVIEILKRLSYFLGFPSGLSILNESLSKEGTMFYAPGIKKIINTWANPERIANGNIKECLQPEPKIIFDWLKNEYHFFDKLS